MVLICFGCLGLLFSLWCRCEMWVLIEWFRLLKVILCRLCSSVLWFRIWLVLLVSRNSRLNLVVVSFSRLFCRCMLWVDGLMFSLLKCRLLLCGLIWWWWCRWVCSCVSSIRGLIGLLM